jgi:hypothetical protein
MKQFSEFTEILYAAGCGTVGGQTLQPTYRIRVNIVAVEKQ